MSKTSSNTTPVGVIILAAGQGKRMRSTLPKVLQELGGQPMLFHILDRVKSVLPHANIALVVGHDRERVESAVHLNSAYSDMKIEFVHQAEQKGTGHAARCAMEGAWGNARAKEQAQVLVLPGDLPLIPDSLLTEMTLPMGRTDEMRLLTCELADPTGYGRVIRRGKKGPVIRIVEEKDANTREKEIHEVGTSIYIFKARFLQFGLQRLSNKNAQKEYYLTDLVAFAARGKKKVDVLKWSVPTDLRGINDPWELAVARGLINERVLRAWAAKGVKFMDPASTWVDVQVELSEDVTIYPGVLLSGKTRIQTGALIGPHSVLKNMEVGPYVNIKAGTVAESSSIAAKASLGPYAHIRPDSVIGEGAKIGNFVEIKKASIGASTSVAHLSYIGDAEVGSGVNIGCGFVTCNFDGRVINGQRKHRTIIEDDAFIGSDCQVIAPIRIGKGAYVASGSTLTEDVEAEALALARSKQVTKPGYARKLRGKGA